MKNLLLTILAAAILSGCSTSTQKASTYKNISNSVVLGGAVAAGGRVSTEDKANPNINMLPMNFQKTAHQIEISGVVMCEHSGFLNFSKLRVDIYDGSSLSSTLNVDSDGKYSSTFKAKEGNHKAQLISRINGEVLDVKEFMSSKSTDRFSINLTECPK